MFKKNLINKLLIALILALAVGFFVSRAMVSMATIALFLTAIIYQLKYKTGFHHRKPNHTFVAFTGFYMLIMVCSLFAGKFNCFTEPLIAFAPLFLLPFAFQVFDQNLSSLSTKINFINWVFIGGALFLLLDMAYRQGFNSAAIVQLAHDSKNVSNILGIHHNIVGFMAIYAIFYLSELLKEKRKPITVFLLVLIIFLIHYLGLRFAVMAFYPLGLIYLLRLKINPAIKLYAFGLGLFLVILSFLFIPAFSARYQNTKADLQNITAHHNPNFYSLNQRLIANQIGLNIAKENWVSGVGTCQIKEYVEQEYVKNSRLLIPENRKFIHNQLIYGWATFGILYVFGWLALFGFLIYKGIKESSILLEITLLFVMHQMVENTLEKQLMLVLFIYFSILMPKGLEETETKK